MGGNSQFQETAHDVVLGAVQHVGSLLPRGWGVVPSGSGPLLDADLDASVVVRAPDGQAATFLATVKTGRIDGADWVVERLRRVKDRTGYGVMLVAPYVGTALRHRCEAADVNYVDLTGWCWMHASTPAMAIRSVGAARDPRPPRASIITRLNGAGAGRVVRVLLDDACPVGVRALSLRAQVSAGTVSKVLKELDSDAVVTRDSAGQVVAVRKRPLVERWTRDYSFLRSNDVGWYLDPRGVQHALAAASTEEVPTVVTGSVAARRALAGLTSADLLPVTALSQLALYVPRVGEAAAAMALVPAGRTVANVLLAEPYDPRLLVPEDTLAGELPATGVGQALADLMTMPGRAPQEAEQLMDLLASTDESWR